ncbi:MAG: TetR/AcrR family transcriptional regulator [Anaerolineales bacterium]|nr:TetR/AcrR family transcriptional regulator [Anaerolineales bacterium]
MTHSEPALRSQILVIAQRKFIASGYHGLAMREIAEALGVSKAALYYHFKDKEELFLAVLLPYLDSMEGVLDDIAAQPGSSAEHIRRFVSHVLGQLAEERAIIRLGSQEMGQLSAASRKAFGKVYQEKFIGKLKAIVQAGMARGEFRQLDPEIVTWALLGMMYPYFYPAHTGNKALPEETIRIVTSIFLEGIAPPAAR